MELDTNSSSSTIAAEEWREQQKIEEALHASSLQVPRRHVASLDTRDIVMVVDARDPLFYRCPDLEAYAREIDEHKKVMLLVNKADLLPPYVREKWAEYFRLNDILFVFWSAIAATAELEGKVLKEPWRKPDNFQKTDDPEIVIYGRDELLSRLQYEAQEIVKLRNSRAASSAETETQRENAVSRPPHAAELLRAYCASRSYVASSGLPDETKAARLILKDYIGGKLPHFAMPPGVTQADEPETEDTRETGGSDSEDSTIGDEAESEQVPDMGEVLEDLSSFDIANGLASSKKVAVKKQTASHKQHKKPQRKKDRNWRVKNTEDGDGMPLVKVFQKPANTGPLTMR
ncbi:unnamed protein product [Thlaspi arvense]|uniref:Uncharacterized protein n=1 Tax=Thlaspi arvense TaxID=13288 RepID=A0AAU9RDL1_THLAR|nr:unnamed protein product [Thlaspi arvense]